MSNYSSRKMQCLKHITVVIVCIHLFTVVEAEVTSKIKKVFVPKDHHGWVLGNSLVKPVSPFSSPGMVFARCYKTSIGQEKCSVFLETTKPIDSDDHLKHCNFTLDHTIDSLIAFGKDKAVLQWYHGQYMADKFAVVHFSDCKYYPVEKDYVIDTVSYVVPGDNTFSIIVHSNSAPKSSCKVGRLCKITLDDKGHMLTGMIPWDRDEFYVRIDDIVYSPLKGHLLIEVVHEELQVGHISNGKFEVIKKLDRSRELEFSYAFTSKIHNLLTVCYRESWSKIDCEQFDLDGNSKFTAQVKTYIRDSTPLVFNLPEGGFFLINDDCSIRDIHGCDKEYQSCISVTKVNATGHTVGCTKITCQLLYHTFFTMKDLHFHINDNGKYCVSYPFTHAAYDEEDYSYMNFNIVCFENEDLNIQHCPSRFYN